MPVEATRMGWELKVERLPGSRFLTNLTLTSRKRTQNAVE